MTNFYCKFQIKNMPYMFIAPSGIDLKFTFY